jgi:nucleotide-binding universal stress UspA family protein
VVAPPSCQQRRLCREVPSRASNEAFRETLREEAQAMLDRAAASTGEAEVATEAIADVSPPHALHTLAERIGAALVVVGSTRRGPAGRVLPGSTAERLLHGSSCPVAIVPHGYATQDAGPSYMPDFVDYQAKHREGLERAVAALPDDESAKGVFVAGRPSADLAAQSEDVDLMVVGSRGYGPLAAVLLGGVTHGLVRKAACPVIVLPRGEHAGIDELFASGAEATTAA